MRDAQPKTLTKTVLEILLLSGVVIAPLVFIPVFNSFLVSSKILLLFLTAIAFLLLFVWRTLRTQTLELPRSPLVLPLFLFGISTLVSSVLTSVYPMENLMLMGGVYLATTLIAILGASYLRSNSDHRFMNTLSVVAAVLSLATVLEYFGFGPSRLLNQLIPINFPNNNTFSLAGSMFMAAQFMTLAVIGNVAAMAKRRKVNVVQAVTTPIILIGLGLAAFSMLPGKPNSPVILPFDASWQVAVEALKTPRTALIGYGPESYSDAFQRFKPATLNTTPVWSVIFSQAMNTPLTILPTLGLIGLGLWIFLATKTLNLGLNSFKNHPGLVAVVLGSLVLQLLTPPSLILIWLQAIALAYFIANHEQTRPLIVHLFKISYFETPNSSSRQGVAMLVPFIIPTLACLALGYALLRPISQAYAASHYFLRSIMAQNDLGQVFDNQRRATQSNRYVSAYRSNFAITSLTAANALLGKKDATDTDKQQANELAQLAINEAKAATALRPMDSQSWQVLGQIYATLTLLKAEGADQWTLLAYTEAIQNSPSNPILRMQLGSFLASQQKHGDAALLFDQALRLKSDLTPAAYGLAVALKQVNNFTQSRLAYQRTLDLLDPASEDYKTVQTELAEVEKKLAELEAQQKAQAARQGQTQTGTTASPSPSPATLPSVINQNVTQSDDDAVEADNNAAVPSDLDTTPTSTGSAQTP